MEKALARLFTGSALVLGLLLGNEEIHEAVAAMAEEWLADPDLLAPVIMAEFRSNGWYPRRDASFDVVATPLLLLLIWLFDWLLERAIEFIKSSWMLGGILDVLFVALFGVIVEALI